VNVHTLGDRLVLLEPLHTGETNLVFVDEESIAITNIRIVVFGTSPIPIDCRDTASLPGSIKRLNGSFAPEAALRTKSIRPY
jgi:hypothetical protein